VYFIVEADTNFLALEQEKAYQQGRSSLLSLL